MGQGTFRVVLTGEVIEGFERSLVVAAVAKLFKCPEPQAERVLQGKTTPLKREMDAQTAERYKQQLIKSGIACRLEAVAPAPSILELSLEEDLPAKPEPVKNSAPVAVRPVAVPEAASVPNWTLVEDEAKKAAEAEAAEGFRCPKCGTPQEQGVECIKCGIIFSKYQPIETAVAAYVQPEEEEEAADETDEWDDLALFVGANMEKYRVKFRQLYQNDGRFQLQWHWPAFLAPVPWMIHRKLYPWAAVFLLMQLVIPPMALLLLWVIPGALGNYLYYRHALWRIRKITSVDEERRSEIINAGGTNSMPVTIGASFLAGMLMSVVYFQFFLPPELEQAMEKSAANRDEILNVQDNPTKVQMLMLKNTFLIQKNLKAALKEQFAMPQDMDELRQLMSLPPKSTQDKWGTQMQFEMIGDTMVFRSAGADKTFDTDDDVVLETKE